MENKIFEKIFNEANGKSLKESPSRINWRPTGLLEFELKLEDNSMIGNFFESLISLGFGFTIKPRGDSGLVDVGIHVTYLNEEIENVLKSWLGDDWGKKIKLNGRV